LITKISWIMIKIYNELARSSSIFYTDTRSTHIIQVLQSTSHPNSTKPASKINHLPNPFKTLVYGAIRSVFSQHLTFKWDLTTLYYVSGNGSTILSIKICVQPMCVDAQNKMDATIRKTLILEVSCTVYSLYAKDMAPCCLHENVWHYIKQNCTNLEITRCYVVISINA
jgi:hypothetical protein